jgi:hypothetical protein
MEREEHGAEHRSINPSVRDSALLDQRLSAGLSHTWPTAEEIQELPASTLPALLVQLAAVQMAIAARLAEAGVVRHQAPADDRLLDVEEAAQVLGLSKDFLYSSPTLKSLRVKVGSRVLFSSRRLQHYIERQAGRG